MKKNHEPPGASERYWNRLCQSYPDKMIQRQKSASKGHYDGFCGKRSPFNGIFYERPFRSRYEGGYPNRLNVYMLPKKSRMIRPGVSIAGSVPE